MLCLLTFALLLGTFCACGTEKSEKVWTDGVAADGVYTNECLSLCFQIPEDWAEPGEEEKRAILGADEADSTTIYDVLLGSTTSLDKMYVSCVDLSIQIGGTKLTAEDYLQETMDGLLSQEGFADVTEPGSDTVMLCGQEYTYADVQTAECIERLMLRKISDSELIMIGLVASDRDDLDYYLTRFTDDPDSIPERVTAVPVDGNGSFSRGVISGGAYSSKYLGLRFTPPEDWVYASDEELAELMGASFEIIGEDIYGDETELAKEFAKQAVIYDMVAAAPDGGNVQIMLENLSKSVGGTSLTAEGYADIVCTQLDAITEYQYTYSDVYYAQLGDKTFAVLDTGVEDYDMHQQFWLLRVDQYMLCITFTSIGGDASAFAEYFTAL